MRGEVRNSTAITDATVGTNGPHFPGLQKSYISSVQLQKLDTHTGTAVLILAPLK